MAPRRAIAVLDIGKSNAKVALVEWETKTAIAVRTTPNTVRRDGLYPHFDADGLWCWIQDCLKAFVKEADIVAISTTTHGASCALLAGDTLAFPILDYEHDGPESVRDAYDAERGDFAETLSPNLPNGLNVGRQLFWLSRAFPEAFQRADAIVTYPQYWVWRLTGERVAEATSLGCHTDLWNPKKAAFSSLATRENWSRLFPPLVNAWDVVGHLRPDVISATGLSPECKVVAGIHDSNASLLPHLKRRQLPFAVVSTGTWMITFAPGGSLDRLDPDRDCLANVDAFRRPVPSAMVMAGREFEILSGSAEAPEPSAPEVAQVVSERIMALPTFVSGSGPFPTREGIWSTDANRLAPGVRVAAASLYCAMISQTCLGLTGAKGPVVVEGPFARNRLFLSALAQLVDRPVIAQHDATGTTAGAALLALGEEAPAERSDAPPVAALDIDVSGYASVWLERAAA